MNSQPQRLDSSLKEGERYRLGDDRLLRVSLLTGGHDRPYVTGLVSSLTANGVFVDVVGSDVLCVPELLHNPGVRFLNLRGDQRANASVSQKIMRLAAYYWRLIIYTMNARPKLFHILWNNKFELFDRTLLMLYYKLTGKCVLLTAHNVNIRKRDCRDNWLNRLSLKVQYGLSDHVFVHTERMKDELTADFKVAPEHVSVIPFGINNSVPETELTSTGAKMRLGLSHSDKALLCFGQIAPYKGLEYVIAAFCQILSTDKTYRLIIAGEPKGDRCYWKEIDELITKSGVRDRVVTRIEHVSDEETEMFFKAADVAILPYTDVFQSGVLFLSYAFGLPVVAADVGSLRKSIMEGATGLIFRPRDSSDLAHKIRDYFDSDLYRNLETRRREIKSYANERYSWATVGNITVSTYMHVLRRSRAADSKAFVKKAQAPGRTVELRRYTLEE